MDNYENLFNEFMDKKCKYEDDDMYKDMNKCKCPQLYNCSSNVFGPVCSNAICTVPRMDMTTMVAEGQGTINGDDDVDEEEGSPVDESPVEDSSRIDFKFFIGKKFSKYVGTLCLVNYDEEIFINSEELECYHSQDHTKFVAIFHVEQENKSREIVLFVSAQICNILPTLFLYSAPQCGFTDELVMGGTVTTGTVTIAKKDEKESSMNH